MCGYGGRNLWLLYMTWSDFENSPSLSSQTRWPPHVPSSLVKAAKIQENNSFVPWTTKNSIPNRFSFIMKKRPRQLSGAQQPWNKEGLYRHTTTSEPAQPFILCPCCGMALQLPLWRKKPKPSERWAVKVQTLLLLLSHCSQGVLIATPDQ